MNLNNEYENSIVQHVLRKKRLELHYPGVNFDNVTKENLLDYILDLEDKISILKDPRSDLTSKRLVKAYLKSFSFPRLQKRLLSILADMKVKTILDIQNGLYYRKVHPPEKPKDAIKKLIGETRKNIKASGSADVFEILPKDGGYYLKIVPSNLNRRIKKRS